MITAPVGNADQHADLHVSISYASGGGGYQTSNWAYRIDSAFPAYGSPHGGTQVTGTTSVNDFLSGQANGSRLRLVALLDPSGNLHNPPVTHDAWINYQYESPGGGGGGGNQAPFGLGSVSPLTIAENQPALSLVGVLVASDPDSASILTFTFANGNGAEANQLFTLESNGTLRSMTVFDFEHENLDGNASLSIRVRVTDQAGAWIEKILPILVTDIPEATPNSPPVISNTMATFTVIENTPQADSESIVRDGCGCQRFPFFFARKCKFRLSFCHRCERFDPHDPFPRLRASTGPSLDFPSQRIIMVLLPRAT